MRKTLNYALKEIFNVEAGYQNSRHDKGNYYRGKRIGTNRGIAAPTLASWLGRAPSLSEMRNLTQKTATAILEARYARVIHYNDLPAGLDYAMLDFAVNSGPSRAVKELQDVLGVKKDGLLGGITLRAVKRNDVPKLIAGLRRERLKFLKNLSNYWKFGKGWRIRVEKITKEALALHVKVAGKK